jgi:uncharacterized protein
MIRVGVISDTHGQVRREAAAALKGSDLIVHAGDVGHPDVLTELSLIAPVHAVRGNNDYGAWAKALPLTRVVEVGDVLLYVLHIRDDLDLDPAAAGMSAVIYGHTHEPFDERSGGVLYLNPGSAGPRRFRLPITLARLTVDGRELSVEHVALL